MSVREITENGANIKMQSSFGTKMEFGNVVQDTSVVCINVTVTRDGKELVNGTWDMVYDKFNPILRARLASIAVEMKNEFKTPRMTERQIEEFEQGRDEIKKAMNI